MTENQMNSIITFILATGLMLMSFIAFTSGNTFGGISAGLGWIYFSVDSCVLLAKQKYDANGKPV